MKSQPPYRSVHVCDCPACQQGERSEIVEEHRAINQLLATLDEKWRRLFAGFWATVYGRGGVERRASAHFYDDLVNSAALRPPA